MQHPGLVLLAVLALAACQDVDDAWTGNGDMSTAVDAVLLAIAKATGR